MNRSYSSSRMLYRAPVRPAPSRRFTLAAGALILASGMLLGVLAITIGALL